VSKLGGKIADFLHYPKLYGFTFPELEIWACVLAEQQVSYVFENLSEG